MFSTRAETLAAKPLYVVNPHRHVKIWFSEHEDLFMNQENQLRLVKMRVKNPTDQISLVFSAALLSDKAIGELHRFCKKHNITPLSLESDIKNKLVSDEERLRLFCAQLELTRCKNDTGGNLAAASDIVRTLSPVYKAGLYTDLDLPGINTKDLPHSIPVYAPIVCTLGSSKVTPFVQTEVLATNNDILIIPEINPTLEGDELTFATITQNEMLARYHQLITASYTGLKTHFENVIAFFRRQLCDKVKVDDRPLYSQLDVFQLSLILSSIPGDSPMDIRCNLRQVDKNKLLAEEFIRSSVLEPEKIPAYEEKFGFSLKDVKTPTQYETVAKSYLYTCKQTMLMLNAYGMSIPGFPTTFLTQSDDVIAQALADSITFKLFKLSVTATTGPILLYLLLQQAFASYNDIDKYCAIYSIHHYDQLSRAFKINNGHKLHASLQEVQALAQKTFGECGDLAWSTRGKQAMQSRENVMIEKAKVIQRWYLHCKKTQRLDEKPVLTCQKKV